MISLYDQEKAGPLIAAAADRLRTRRVVITGAAVGGVAALAGCGPNGPDITTITTDIEHLIQQVQSGVASACAAVGKLVPTVDTVLQVVEGLLGASITTANIAAAVALAQGAIDSIVKIGCPTPAAGPRAANTSVVINGKTVPVVFY